MTEPNPAIPMSSRSQEFLTKVQKAILSSSTEVSDHNHFESAVWINEIE